MAMNPLLPDSNSSAAPQPSSELAADVIRQKLLAAYDSEPDAKVEEAEAEAVTHRTKHQQFMYDLNHSGKDLATIQTEWHNYYVGLPEQEKHAVWQEFYSSQSAITHPAQVTPQAQAEHKQQASQPARHKAARTKSQRPRMKDLRSPAAIQATIRDTVSAGGALGIKHHLQSLFFGLAMGLVVVIIFLFSFFNEVIIAPFIQPSRASAATPLIVDANSAAPSKDPQVIIPKINVQIPTIYTATSINEAEIENNLEDGVVHYPSTVNPGENGNAVYFGHSSNNILNPGKYKFAFVLLHKLVLGDTFYLTKNSKVYVYKVISRNIVEPTDVSVLGPVAGQTATATLITCDPPGTSLRRLIVVGQQISPSVSGNTEAAAPTQGSPTAATVTSLPGKGQTLLSRVVSTTIGKIILGAALVTAIIATIRWTRNLKR